MSDPSTYRKDLTLKQLTRRIRNDEGLAGSVSRLGHTEELTWAEFDDGDVPEGDLLLDELESPDDEERDGSELICKGEVWIESELKDVGAFREI